MLAEMRRPCRKNARIRARDKVKDHKEFDPTPDRSERFRESIGGVVEKLVWENMECERFRRLKIGWKRLNVSDDSTSTNVESSDESSVDWSMSRKRRICGLIRLRMSRRPGWRDRHACQTPRRVLILMRRR